MEILLTLKIVGASIMALITLYLTILYIKSEAFHTYSCYNIIIMSIVILLDSLLQIIPKDKIGIDGLEYVINLVTFFFDKMIMTISSMEVIVIYMGIIHSEYYISHEKSVFIGGLVICTIISGVLAVIYSSIRWITDKNGTSYNEEEKTDQTDEEVKEIMIKRIEARHGLEIIFCVVLFIGNCFCLIVIMAYISKKKKEVKAGIIEDSINYEKQLIRFLFIFFINIIALAISSTIMNYKLLDEYDGIIYLVICFAIDLCYSINNTVYAETLRIFCKKKKYDEEGKYIGLKKTSTFGKIVDEDDNDEY